VNPAQSQFFGHQFELLADQQPHRRITDLGVIGSNGARLHDPAPRRRSQLGHRLVQLIFQLRLTQFPVPRQSAQLFDRPLGNTGLARQRHCLIIQAAASSPARTYARSHRPPAMPICPTPLELRFTNDSITSPTNRPIARSF
jgi:hypothetical protein